MRIILLMGFVEAVISLDLKTLIKLKIEPNTLVRKFEK